MSIKYETFPPYSASEQIVVDECYLLHKELMALKSNPECRAEAGIENRVDFLRTKVRELSIQIESFG